MFDTMTLTKVTAGVCAALLVFLLGNWAATSLYSSGGHHGEQSYVIDTGDDGAAEEVVEVAFADVFAAADAGKGEKLFRKCSACHKLDDGANGAGPYLYQIVGRDIGAANGFAYSDVLNTLEGDWTPENLNGFLESPGGFAKGTKMPGSAAVKKIEDRANLIAYLATVGN